MLSDPNQPKASNAPSDAPEVEATVEPTGTVTRGESLSEGRARSGNLLVMALLGIDVILGGAIAAAGYFLLESPAIALVGAGMATIGVCLMLIFQLFGRER